MTKIKICGITNYQDAKAALDLGVDALGFNFYAKSPRVVAVSEAQMIIRRLPPTVWYVGVFVNHSREEVKRIARAVGLDTLQFHGDEDVEFCQGWKEWRVIKALRMGGDITEDDLKSFAKVVDLLLLDAAGINISGVNVFGGTGQQIEEIKLESLKETGLLAKVFLAGGLSPGNVAEKVKQFLPYGVDVASSLETSPGKKDLKLMTEFVKQIRDLAGTITA